jgi:hypothetical protein
MLLCYEGFTKLPTVLKTAECVVALRPPAELSEERAWFAIGSARRVITIASVGSDGSVRCECFGALPAGATGPEGRAAEAFDDVVTSLASLTHGSTVIIAAARGAGMGRLALSRAEGRWRLERLAWLPEACATSVQGVSLLSPDLAAVGCEDGAVCTVSLPSEGTPGVTCLAGRHSSLCSVLCPLPLDTVLPRLTPKEAKKVKGAVTFVSGGHDCRVMHHWVSGKPPPGAELNVGALDTAASAAKMINPPFVNGMSLSEDGLIVTCLGSGEAILSVFSKARCLDPIPLVLNELPTPAAAEPSTESEPSLSVLPRVLARAESASDAASTATRLQCHHGPSVHAAVVGGVLMAVGGMDGVVSLWDVSEASSRARAEADSARSKTASAALFRPCQVHQFESVAFGHPVNSYVVSLVSPSVVAVIAALPDARIGIKILRMD